MGYRPGLQVSRGGGGVERGGRGSAGQMGGCLTCWQAWECLQRLCLGVLGAPMHPCLGVWGGLMGQARGAMHPHQCQGLSSGQPGFPCLLGSLTSPHKRFLSSVAPLQQDPTFRNRGVQLSHDCNGMLKGCNAGVYAHCGTLNAYKP